MHQCLRLRRTGVEHAAGFPKDLEDVGIVFAFLVPPADETGVETFTFHADVFFDADGKAVERTRGAFVFGVVGVEVFGSRQGVFGEKLGDAV